MTGLLLSDFIIFKKRCHWLYRIGIAAVVLGVLFLLQDKGAEYIAILLPFIGIAWMTEVVTVNEKSDMKHLFPTLPISHKAIVLSRYCFCGIVLAAAFTVSFLLCCAAALLFDAVTISALLPYSFFGFLYAFLACMIGVPSGYFFKGQVCTATLIYSAFPLGILYNIYGIGPFTNLLNPAGLLLTFFLSLLLLYLSFRLSLLIYTGRIRLKRKRNAV